MKRGKETLILRSLLRSSFEGLNGFGDGRSEGINGVDLFSDICVEEV
jgi:hypothetical protein